MDFHLQTQRQTILVEKIALIPLILYQTLSGVNPASSPPNNPLPVELFEGRTTNLGDSYYVGLFAPDEPAILGNGAKFLWGAGFDLGFDTAAEGYCQVKSPKLVESVYEYI